ncbi:hypothetical protein GCM10028805_02180 [Spirosoma harenae]
MLAFGWKETLSVRWQQFLYTVLAVGWWLFAYMAIYVCQLYFISIPMLIALGLSAHTFVPLFFAVALGKRLWFDGKREEHLRLGISVGLSIPLIAVGFFLSGWIRDLNRIEKTQLEATIRNTTDLPDWVLIAQKLKPGWITNRLLLSNHVYDLGRFINNSGWSINGLTALDDVRQHDPLVVIASLILPADVLSNDNRLAITRVLAANRHGTEEKFWTGRHLTTEDVVSQVRIWPQFRVSYTEQTFQIRNQARFTTEEALLTFHLPPGSVVSSMSLWVNGHEEPARLTTVAKADSAYRTIVGVESKVVARDPSIVRWQEGNRVTVRVFPCRAGEDRRVKIGITSPLQLTDNQLNYQSPYIEGPDMSSANELIHIDFVTTPTDLQTPWLFNQLQGNVIQHTGNYTPNWTLRFQAPDLSSEAFYLNGYAYQMDPQTIENESFTPTDIYLDINQLWQRDEFTTAFQLAAKQPNSRVWVFDDGMKQLTQNNLDAFYERLSQETFSLFPVYRIKNPATALLITKGSSYAPTLSDLRGSQFADNFGLVARQQTPIRTFCFTSGQHITELSPYLKTLSELCVLNLTSGNSPDLTGIFQKHQFPRLQTEKESVNLLEAQVAIQKIPAPVAKASLAPDHLARLFTYNHLLREIGRSYFIKNYQTDFLIQEAQRAHIVSPLSSLVVLETAADYGRFGIPKDNSGLDNASLKTDGAVPEPHEWAMLVMLAILVGWLIWRKHYAPY